MTMNIVKSKVLCRYSKFVRANNGDPLFLLEQAGINKRFILGEAYILHQKVAQLFNISAKALNMPFFGLLYANELEGIKVANLEHFFSFQSNLNGVLCFLKKYQHLHTDAFQIDFFEKENTSFLKISFLFENEVDAWQLKTLAIARMARIIKMLLADKIDASELRVEIPYAGHALSVIEKQSCNVHFNRNNETLLTYPSFWNQISFLPNENDLLYVTNEYLERESNIRPQYFSEHVKHAISQKIKNNEVCTAASIANDFFMHVRTFQNKLKAENTSFMREFNVCRFDLAREMLFESQLSINDISVSLGFADVSSFTRAFKQWSGITPSQWRCEHNVVSELV